MTRNMLRSDTCLLSMHEPKAVKDALENEDWSKSMTRNKLRSDTCLLSMHEPKTMKDASENEDQSKEMKEEIEQIERNKTWTLVPTPEDKNVIGTKCVFRNKLDENGEVRRNKERLVCKGYEQEEGIDYG